MTSPSANAPPSSQLDLFSTAADPSPTSSSASAKSAPPAFSMSRDQLEAESWRYSSTHCRLLIQLTSGNLAVLGDNRRVVAIVPNLAEAFAFPAYPPLAPRLRTHDPRPTTLPLNFEGL